MLQLALIEMSWDGTFDDNEYKQTAHLILRLINLTGQMTFNLTFYKVEEILKGRI